MTTKKRDDVVNGETKRWYFSFEKKCGRRQITEKDFLLAVLMT
jgi:hypothetical protein